MQDIQQLHIRLESTTLDAYNPDIELRLKIKLFDTKKVSEVKLEKCDLGDGIDWYQYQDKYYRLENGKYLDYDENGNDVVVNFNQGESKEKAIKFSIFDKELYEYQGELLESEIQSETQNKLDIYDYFLSLEEDIQSKLFKKDDAIIEIRRIDEQPPIHYIVKMSMSYQPSRQVYHKTFQVKCNEIEKSCEDQLLISNDKWFKCVSELKQQYKQQEERVRILEEQVRQQNELIKELQMELDQD